MKGQNEAVLNCKEETPAEKWERAGIGNDLIFAHVMSNQELFLGQRTTSRKIRKTS